ncbi:MAG: hypothetical protein AAGI13_05385 [Pseudomonadota bacterium]
MAGSDEDLASIVRALEAEKASIPLRVRLAERLQAEGEAALAHEVLDLTVHDFPLDPAAWTARADWRAARGDEAGALDDLRHALFAREDDPGALSRTADLCRRLGRWREARAAQAALGSKVLSSTG